MKTRTLPHSPNPLPLDVQIARHSDRYALACFVAGVCVGALGASLAWCWLNWKFYP